MNNLNSVLIEGNLTKDPELSYTPNEKAVCKLRLATNRYYKQGDEPQEEASFFDVTVWGRQAEACAEYLKKGRGIRVVGRLKQERWEAQDGSERSRVAIIAEHVEFKPRAKTEQGDDETEPDAGEQQSLTA